MGGSKEVKLRTHHGEKKTVSILFKTIKNPFGQGFDEGFEEGKKYKYSLQYNPACGNMFKTMQKRQTTIENPLTNPLQPFEKAY